MRPPEVVRLLAGALSSVDADYQRSKRVTRMADLPVSLLLNELSNVEREARDATSIRLIATAKRTITGKTEGREFLALCDRVMGLV